MISEQSVNLTGADMSIVENSRFFRSRATYIRQAGDLLFWHLPRVGGTSFWSSISDAYRADFNLIDAYDESLRQTEDIFGTVKAYLDLSAQADPEKRSLVHHHTLFPLHNHISASTVVCLFRDPVERVISYYQHNKEIYSRQGESEYGNLDELSIIDFCLKFPSIANSYFCMFRSYQDSTRDEFRISHYSSVPDRRALRSERERVTSVVQRVLDSPDFVPLLSEHMQGSVILFDLLMGRAGRSQVRRLNSSVAAGAAPSASISTETRLRLEEICELDLSIYGLVLARVRGVLQACEALCDQTQPSPVAEPRNAVPDIGLALAS